jgi:hypothetical protein
MSNNPFDSIEVRLDEIRVLISNLNSRINPDNFKRTADIGGMELAKEVTRLSSSTIYKLVAKRAIPFVKKKKHSKLYFSRTALEKWITEK